MVSRSEQKRLDIQKGKQVEVVRLGPNFKPAGSYEDMYTINYPGEVVIFKKNRIVGLTFSELKSIVRAIERHQPKEQKQPKEQEQSKEQEDETDG